MKESSAKIVEDGILVGRKTRNNPDETRNSFIFIGADSYRYAYKVQGIGMIGESLALKSGSNFYYIHSYIREKLRDPSLQVLDEFFGGVTWEE